jgi:hypothetical protein
MKIKYLLFAGSIAVLSSCSTAYRSGQTPDDVYFSPAPQPNEYVSHSNGDDQDSYYYRNNEEDYNIRRGIENPAYRAPLSLSLGFGYSPYSYYPYNSLYNPYGYNSYYGYSPFGMKGMYNPYFDDFGYNGLSFYNPYSLYNPYYGGYGYSPFGYGYSPFYSSINFYSKPINTNTGARRYNLGGYTNNLNRNNESGSVQPIRNTQTGVAPESNGTGMGRVIRRVFSPSERNSYTPSANSSRREVRRSNSDNNRRSSYYNNNERRSNSYEAPTRSFSPSTPSSSSSSSSSGSGSSSAPVRTFRR